MKKLTLFASACAIFVAQSLSAQEAASQEVTYVPDPTQGYLMNKFSDNWFITGEVGANVYFSHYHSVRDFTDRFAPAAGVYVGKWFTPVFGARLGINWLANKSLVVGHQNGYVPDEPTVEGYNKAYFSKFGPMFDVMVNLTNWWCGYKPGRVYNASVYVGAGGYLTYVHKVNSHGKKDGWKNSDNGLAFRGGLLNTFNVSKSVQLSLDLRASAYDALEDLGNENRTALSLQAYAGITYLFPNREWKAPVVPVCPPAENCDALRARLSAADARISDLENQLRNCLNRPVQTVVEKEDAPLATIYFPIGVSRMSREDQRIVKAIAEVMKANPKTKYDVTGWADNFTGTEEINVRLRKERAAGVEKLLIKSGVDADQINVGTNNGSLSDLGEKMAALDRAAVITVAK